MIVILIYENNSKYLRLKLYIVTLIFKNRVILKNLENIQGDEADLVIISIAYTKNAYLDSTYVARSGGRNALNVAITRAKQKMIVLKSIKASEIKSSNKSSIDLDTFKR
jgi:superfamily I DNA and/or RNA helicase